MVTKDDLEEKGRVNVGPLSINKETVQDLTADEAQDVKGGRGFGGIQPVASAGPIGSCTPQCDTKANGTNCATGSSICNQ